MVEDADRAPPPPREGIKSWDIHPRRLGGSLTMGLSTSTDAIKGEAELVRGGADKNRWKTGCGCGGCDALEVGGATSDSLGGGCMGTKGRGGRWLLVASGTSPWEGLKSDGGVLFEDEAEGDEAYKTNTLGTAIGALLKPLHR